MAQEISIDGSGEEFTEANDGWTDVEESVPFLTDARANLSINRPGGDEYNAAYARAFVKPTNFPIHAVGEAHISKSIKPTGDESSRFANVTISGFYRGRVAAYGTASASYDVSIFIKNASDDEEVDRYTIKEKNVSLLHIKDKDESNFEDNVSGRLEEGKEYKLGVAIRTFAANRTIPPAPVPFAAGANFHSDTNLFPGFVEWNSIELEWY